MSRITSKTPRFFKIVGAIGVSLAAIGTALLTAPVVLPAAIVMAGGYLVTGGIVAKIVAQCAKDGE